MGILSLMAHKDEIQKNSVRCISKKGYGVRVCVDLCQASCGEEDQDLVQRILGNALFNKLHLLERNVNSHYVAPRCNLYVVFLRCCDLPAQRIDSLLVR
jgi:3-dehydroquinate synthase class II